MAKVNALFSGLNPVSVSAEQRFVSELSEEIVTKIQPVLSQRLGRPAMAGDLNLSVVSKEDAVKLRKDPLASASSKIELDPDGMIVIDTFGGDKRIWVELKSELFFLAPYFRTTPRSANAQSSDLRETRDNEWHLFQHFLLYCSCLER